MIGFVGLPLIDRRGDHRRRAIHFAAAEGHVDVVEFLISRGVDVSATCRYSTNCSKVFYHVKFTA